MQPVVMALEFGAEQRNIVGGVRRQPRKKESIGVSARAPENRGHPILVAVLLKQLSKSAGKCDFRLREGVGIREGCYGVANLILDGPLRIGHLCFQLRRSQEFKFTARNGVRAYL